MIIQEGCGRRGGLLSMQSGARMKNFYKVDFVPFIIIIVICPLFVQVIRTLQMISQPVSSIFLFCAALWDLANSGPVHSLIIFPPLPLSALSSSPFHCALQDGFGQTWWTGDMTIPLQFAFVYDGQEVFVWSNCLLDLGRDFIVGNMVFVWDV